MAVIARDVRVFGTLPTLKEENVYEMTPTKRDDVAETASYKGGVKQPGIYIDPE